MVGTGVGAIVVVVIVVVIGSVVVGCSVDVVAVVGISVLRKNNQYGQN